MFLGELGLESLSFMRIIHRKPFVQFYVFNVSDILGDGNCLRIPAIGNVYFLIGNNDSEATSADFFNFFVFQLKLLKVHIFVEVHLE